MLLAPSISAASPEEVPHLSGSEQLVGFGQLKGIIEDMVPGLQTHLGETWHYPDVPAQFRLRLGVCEPASNNIADRLHDAGISAEPVFNETLHASLPTDGLSAEDEERLMAMTPNNHQIVVAETTEGKVVIDGSFGQLFMPFGLDFYFAETVDTDPFPASQVLVFLESETSEVADNLARFVQSFWSQYAGSEAFQSSLKDHARPPITDWSLDQLRNFFIAVWNLDNYEVSEGYRASRRAAGRLALA